VKGKNVAQIDQIVVIRTEDGEIETNLISETGEALENEIQGKGEFLGAEDVSDLNDLPGLKLCDQVDCAYEAADPIMQMMLEVLIQRIFILGMKYGRFYKEES
jgi:hypothetical protein